jgi:hypothetical protein
MALWHFDLLGLALQQLFKTFSNFAFRYIYNCLSHLSTKPQQDLICAKNLPILMSSHAQNAFSRIFS